MREGKLIDEKIYSQTLNEEIDMLIYLPPEYSALYKYPLFIVQDGKDYIRFGKLAQFVDELTSKNKIQKAVFALLPYKDIQDRRAKYHPDGEQNEEYIRFLTHELVPYLERKFPTFAVAGARFLMGESLGASVSLKAALKYPFTFGNVVLHSPLINDDLLKMVKKANPAMLKIFHIIGSKENKVKTTDDQIADFLTPNQKLHALFTQMGFEYVFHLFEGEHLWKYWQPFVKEALLYMLPTHTFDFESMTS